MEDQIRLMKSQLLEKAKQISPEIATAVSSLSVSVRSSTEDVVSNGKRGMHISFFVFNCYQIFFIQLSGG